MAVPQSPRGSRYTSLGVDDAFRFGGPAGKACHCIVQYIKYMSCDGSSCARTFDKHG